MLRTSGFALVYSATAELFCPGQGDFEFEGNTHWNGNGWDMHGGGGVHARFTTNILGGYMEFDMDTSGAHTGVNNNFYVTSPDPSYFSAKNDCDIQGQNKPSCMEMDFVENNGNCIGQTTWHTWPNHNGGCDRGGCYAKKSRSGYTKFRAEFSSDGWMKVTYDGVAVDGYNPTPSGNSKKYVAETMASKGAQIMSSQWVGWVPSGNCGGGGGLGSSSFSVKNIRISGTHVQGNRPQGCGGPSPPSPGPSPPGPPGPSGGGQCCYGGGCTGCSPSAYCKQSQANCEGACGGKWCPGGESFGNTTVVV